MKSQNDKLQDVQQNLGHEPKRISVMINVTELWRKFKKWRKHEKVNYGGSIDSDNDGVSGD
jgi:hypothetical protein